MTRPVRIAFAGLMRAGKDTAAEHLISTLGGGLMKLADPLYEIMRFAQEVAGFTPTKDRPFLMWVGTEWGRAQNEDVWVNALIRRINESKSDDPIFISDARFINEFNALKKAGFTLVKINRPERDRLGAERTLTRWDTFKLRLGIKPKFSVHASERDVLVYNDFDAEIDNFGTISEFEAKVDAVVSAFYGPVV